MTKQEEKKEIDDFLNWFKKEGDKEYPIYIPQIAKYWLSKLRSHDLALKEKIEGMRPGECICSGAEYECEHWGRYETIDDVLSLFNQENEK